MKDLDDSAIRMMTPEDTQTLRDIKLDTENKAPPCFAVQLMWSVTPIDMATLPQLAIFNAYTLYNVEGSRQGRRGTSRISGYRQPDTRCPARRSRWSGRCKFFRCPPA